MVFWFGVVVLRFESVGLGLRLVDIDQHKFRETVGRVYAGDLSSNPSLHLNIHLLQILTCNVAVSKYSWYNPSSSDAQSRSCF